MKNKLNRLPSPLAGLALSIASLGWCIDNVFKLNGAVQFASAGIACVLLCTLILKFVYHPKVFKNELAHPVIGSVLPTFSMGWMVISHSLGQLNTHLGDTFWLLAIVLHIGFLISFIYHRSKTFQLAHMIPSWFVPPVGLMVADVTFSGSQGLSVIAYGVLLFGLLSYTVLLPLMIYRLLFQPALTISVQPTLAIMAAPASLSLAGYLSVVHSPSPLLIGILLSIAILMTMFVYFALFRLLKLPFSPAYAAFTFPLVISATALFKVVDWMNKTQITTLYIKQLHMFAMIELLIASIIVIYVSAYYLQQLFNHPTAILYACLFSRAKS